MKSVHSPSTAQAQVLDEGFNYDFVKSIKGHFFDFSIQKLSIPDINRGYGGAVVKAGDLIVLATADGKFMAINLTDEDIKSDYLPSLEMGSDRIEFSKSITFQETLPRVHDLIFVDGDFFTTYDRYDEKVDATFFIVAKFSKNSDKWQEIYISPALLSPLFTLGSGGALTVDRFSDWLYFSVGDFGLDRQQNLSSDFAPQQNKLPWGHILRISLNNYDVELFSKGHRNPLGLLFVQSQLYSSEMGPRGGDELNLIKQNLNYGWPFESLGTYYESFNEFSAPSAFKISESFTQPIFSWISGVAPTQMVNISSFHKSWLGDVVMGSLKAESIFHFRIDGEKVLFMEQLNIGYRIRDLIEFDNLIVLLTDDSSLLLLSPENRG